MEDFIQNIGLQLEGSPNHDLIMSCTSLLKSEKGIKDAKYENHTLTIQFNPYLISKKEIIHEIEDNGITLLSSEIKNKGFKKWITELANQNKKNLGNQRLDCCDMNH